ncbi:mRNA-decapping enzyme 1A isoform X1 [Neopsephotus bourkii]|uniref:mRNA-decapping enzyme 1A isoform X1 n=2 Tax=Neopsephotus bourkii TaxID=309878 RepID=UPI002AA54731|nr:mRNA-decapping enzyme 1A isoform X1 [Neopsephotus bourkii]XP_061218330.1 mRNA-decapping enzyme 1A isoform X1 [Neopsephotus bourkii]
MESVSRAEQEMSLAALQQHDPYITSIADVTGQVALYSFSPKANEWEKTNIEGTLFVYKRSASPYHGFTIVNRLNMHNLVEPVNKDLEFQLHEPFLLYRNANLSIYSIWFYNKNDCHRIAKLMAKVVQQEAQRSQRVSQDRKSPTRTNGCNENKPIDILEMLSKAKDEYERNQNNDLSIVSSSAMQQNANPPKPESTEPSEQKTSIQVQEQPRQKHLTLEELFGTSVSKEQPVALYPNPERMEKLQTDASAREQHNMFLPFSFDQSTAIQQSLGKSESPSVKTSANPLNQQECLTPMRIPPASGPQPDIKNVSSYSVRLSPILNSASTVEAAPAQILPGLKQNNNIIQVMQQAAKQISPLVNQLPSEVNHGPQNLMAGQSQLTAPLPSANTGTASNTSHTSVDLLQKLRLTPQHDQMQQQSLTKTSVTPNISASVSQLATPESFKESHSKPSTLNSKITSPLQPVQQSKESEIFPQPKTLSKASQVPPPQFVTATTTVTPSILLSPSVFQQSATKPTEVENKASSSSPLTLGTTDIQAIPPTVLSRSQLQEALIHLIKNDSRFLSTIHEVYLQVLTKNTDNIKL